MLALTKTQKIHYTLRLASGMCFIGHGAFGIITKAVWCNYFAVFGIDKAMAYKLMPVVGTIDILMGLTLLIRPFRVIPAWLVIWGILTALCRPLSGESFGEFIERAGNYGAPFCLLLLSGGVQWKPTWLISVIDPNQPANEKRINRVKLALQVVVFLLLLGHAWLNLIHKPSLLNQYSLLGFSNPTNIALLVGIFEIMAALAVLIKPVRPLILAFMIWKMGTELFYPRYGLLEWVERGGSYGCLLALWFCLEPLKRFTVGTGSLKFSELPNS